MTVSATDTPTTVVVSREGVKGQTGTNGTDGAGFNGVRKSLIDNPISWVYKKNKLVNVIDQLLTIDRAVGGSYTDIYGVIQSAAVDEPREEAEGWLVDNTETHSFSVFNNFPLPDDGFSCVLRVGTYAAGAVSQKIFTVPGTTGDLFSIGTDGTGKWLSTIRGSDDIEYNATTVISATSSTAHTVITNYAAGKLDVYVDGVLSGTVTTATTLAHTLDTAGDVIINGNFTLHMQGLRFYPFVLSANEITYLND